MLKIIVREDLPVTKIFYQTKNLQRLQRQFEALSLNCSAKFFMYLASFPLLANLMTF